jgi:hypothetical protein
LPSCQIAIDPIADIEASWQSAVMPVIYIPLLDEGTSVWCPADALVLGDGKYKIVSDEPMGETWAYPTGSLVVCEQIEFTDGQLGIVAVGLAN